MIVNAKKQPIKVPAPLACWHLNADAGGGTHADATANAYTLTIEPGAPAFSFPAGVLGNAWDTTGRAAALSKAYRPASDAAFNFTGDFSISTWVNYGGAGAFYILSKGLGYEATDTSWGLGVDISGADVINVHINQTTGGGNVYSFPVVFGAGWHHIVARRRSGTINVWLDGVLNGTSAAHAGAVNNAYRLSLLSTSNPATDGTADTLVDETAIWDVAISDAVAVYLYNGGVGRVVM